MLCHMDVLLFLIPHTFKFCLEKTVTLNVKATREWQKSIVSPLLFFSPIVPRNMKLLLFVMWINELMVEKLNFFPGLIILPFWQQVSIHNSYTDESLPTLMKWAPSCCNFKGIIVFFFFLCSGLCCMVPSSFKYFKIINETVKWNIASMVPTIRYGKMESLNKNWSTVS